jgi:hypothetical protein
LASSEENSSSEEEDKEILKKKKEKKNEKKKKYKDLLKMAQMEETKKKGNDNEHDIHMEQTFDDSLEGIGKEIAKKTRDAQKKENETWWETSERNRKEKKKTKKKERIEKFKGNGDEDEDGVNEEEKKKKRGELELLVDNSKKEVGYNMKKDFDKERQRRKKGKTEMIESSTDVKFDENDSRFRPLLEDADFNIDPTHSKFKKTEIVQQIREAKLKQPKKVAESNQKDLSSIVNKLKRKASENLEKKTKKKK